MCTYQNCGTGTGLRFQTLQPGHQRDHHERMQRCCRIRFALNLKTKWYRPAKSGEEQTQILLLMLG